VEAFSPRTEQRPPDQFRSGSHGPQVHHRPHLQRLHIKLRVRRFHKVGTAAGRFHIFIRAKFWAAGKILILMNMQRRRLHYLGQIWQDAVRSPERFLIGDGKKGSRVWRFRTREVPKLRCLRGATGDSRETTGATFEKYSNILGCLRDTEDILAVF
jgi:hypothetical protein